MNGRYEHTTRHLLVQSEAQKTKKERQDFAQRHGISSNPTQPFLLLNFDRHLQIPVDPAHCLCQGLDRVLIEATISLFSPAGRAKFADLVRCSELPRGWSRFQDPIHHLYSYFFSDLARLIMVGPLVLVQLNENDFALKHLRSLRLKLGHNSKARVLDDIVDCWVQMATTSVVVFSSLIRSYEELDQSIIGLARQLTRVSYLLAQSFKH